MNKEKWLLLAFITIFVSAIGTYGFAKINDNDPLEYVLSKVTSDLNLTKDQQDQVEKLKSSVRDRWEAEKNIKDNDADQLMNAYTNNDLDWSKLKDYAKNHPAKVQEMKEFAKDKIAEFKSILTPEQKTKLAGKISELRSKVHGSKSSKSNK